GLSESMSNMGSVSDGGSAGHTLLEQLKVINGESWNTQVFGYTLTAAGLMSLMLRVMDQVYRGVSLGNIAESNRWGTVSAIVSFCGLIAAAAGAAPQAALFGLICAGIFAVTKIKDAVVSNYNAKYPLGEATTLEEMVFNYYVSDYNDGTEDAVQNSLRRVLAKIPPPGNAQHALGYDTPTDIRGNGWADALTYILDHYRTEPTKMAEAVMAMYQEYETYINRFFDGLNGQSGDSSTLRDRCWREFISSYLSPSAAPELRYDPERDARSDIRKFSESHSALLSEEVSRCQQIAVWAQGQNQSWSEIWNNFDANSTLSPAINLAPGVTASKVGDLEMFKRFTEEYAESLKKKAMNVLYTNTNKVLSDMYVRYRDDAIKEARTQLLDEVLPFFNTHLTFYIQDESLQGMKMSETPYTKFSFTDMGSFPLFEPTNKSAMREVLDQPLNLKKNQDKPILLVTNVYNYIRWHCPTNVYISNDNDSTEGIADWEQVDFKVDKYIGLAGMEDKIRQTLSPEANAHSIQDVKIPIRFGNKDAQGMEQFLGTWQSESGDRLYRATFRTSDEDESKIEFILELKTKGDENYKTYSQYTLSKKNLGSVYKFDGKNLLISNDHLSTYAQVGDRDFRFRISLQKNALKLEENFGENQIGSYTLFKANPEDGHYDNLVLEADTAMTVFPTMSKISDDVKRALFNKKVAGNSVVIAPEGTVSVTLAPAEVSYKGSNVDGEGLSVSATVKRGSYTFTANTKRQGRIQQGPLTSLPDYTANLTLSISADGEKASGSGINKFENIDMERSRISVCYTESGRLESVMIMLYGDIVTQDDEGKDTTSFIYNTPITITLVPQ
ncbi:MAG: hypothetical protein J6Z35_11260, partial [Lachnospiraceae bacterium]|nr:hypothetical protein [Lachnospiraceae bacterium]